MSVVNKIKLPNNTTVDINDARDVVIGDGVENVVKLTSAQYQALAVKDAGTVYILTDGVPPGGGGGGGGGTGEENVIEIVKVNGTALTPDANKAVDVTVPTESTVSGWGFTKNTGTYSKPSGGIPATDLASAVQTSLGKADTALQSYTETDPVYSASAAAGITSSDISNWNSKTSNVGTITGITMNGSSKGTSGVVNLGTVVTSETDPVFTASAAHGISSTDISNWNAKQKAITVSSSEPTSSQGSNGDIWIVI